MDAGLAAVAASSGGLVTSDDVRAVGVPRAAVRWALRTGELVVVRRGAWCEAAAWAAAGDRERHRVAVDAALRQRPTAVAVAQSAGVVLDLPLPGVPPGAPLLLEARDKSRRGGDGGQRGLARRAWVDADEVATVRGLRVTTPARTVVDLARHLAMPWVLAAADVVLATGAASRTDLLAAAARNPCAPGHPRAVTVAKNADPRAESALESLARGALIGLGLPSGEPQVWVRTSPGRFRVDLLVRQWWTVIEADGKVKYSDPWLLDGRSDDPGEKAWRDKRRRDALTEAGYEVVRFVAADVRRPRTWGADVVRAAVRAHARHGLVVPADLARFAAELAVNRG